MNDEDARTNELHARRETLEEDIQGYLDTLDNDVPLKVAIFCQRELSRLYGELAQTNEDLGA